MANEKRLIDYQKATEIALNELKGKVTTVTAVMLVSKLKYATVDAVEVVRCKDCKHWEDGHFGYCTKIHSAMYYDAFCSNGERREVE